jgi:hypothetical protein
MSAGPPLPPRPPRPGAPQAPAAPQVKAVNCPKCGAAIALRTFGKAETVVCDSCHSILDAQDPNLKILQTFQAAVGEAPPLIPLGRRGKLRGVDYEVTGFQRRSTEVEGIRYIWHEYVLFNPYKGFRYLTEYHGHWNDVSPCKMLPTIPFPGAERAAYLGETYKHFQTCTASTDYVVGEFPWQVRVGEKAEVTDLVSPPRVLSSEKTGNEVTWSIGEYLYGKEVWQAFSLQGDPPPAVGVYENQPSPAHESVSAVWGAFAAFLLALIVLMIGFAVFVAGDKQVFAGSYLAGPASSKSEASFVTDVFELTGRVSNVEVATTADVNNSWIYLNYALINQDTGQAWDFGREVSYYHGRDSDGSWSEGGPKDSVVVPSVPAGHYYLRIEPEVDPQHPKIGYAVVVKRDVPVFGIYGLAFLALLLPAVASTWRWLNFERMRWAESEHPIITIESGSSEDD